LQKKDNDGKNTEFEAQYPDRFWGKMGKVKWDVQFTKEGAEGKGETFKVAENGQTTEVKSVARVWMTQMDNQEGKGNAVCYLLGENGQWYKETANKYRYVAEKNANYWDLKKPEGVETDEQQVMLQGLLGEVKGTDKPEPKDTRNQTRTITFTQVVVS